MKYVGKLEKCALDEGNPTSLRQIHHFPTSQTTLYILSNILPNMLGLIGCPER
jgi:hypothetical protein